MENVVAMEQSARHAVMREVRAYFEPFEDAAEMFDPAKLPGQSKRWYIACAARCAFWAMDENASVRARVCNLCDATERATVASLMPEIGYVEEWGSVKNWIALAQSYLTEDIGRMVRPSFKKRV